MTNTTTQSGQRPPVANRPTDADLARLLDQAAMTIHRLARLVVPEVAEDARKVRDRASAAADALDAAPDAPARLSPAEWAEAVERAAGTFWNASHAVRWRRTGKESPSTLAYLNNADAALRAAFPHLAPEDR